MYKFRCLQQFQAEGPGELSVNEGDIVIASGNVPSDGWLQVKSLRGGGEGFVPFSFLEFLNLQQQFSSSSNLSSGPDQSTVPASSPMSPPPPSDPFQFSSAFNPMEQQQQANPYSMPPMPQVPEGLNQPSVDMFSTSPTIPESNPFDSMNSLQSSLPATETGGPLSSRDRSNRHSYAVGTSTKDQYKVTNPEQFQETLELWRERERRFMKGEPERLPQPKTRVYFYWDRQGVRHGPLSEAEMRARFDTRQLTPDTPISLQMDDVSMDAGPLQQYFPEVNSAFQKAPVVHKQNEITWAYKDDMGLTQGPFPSKQMREWFQDGYFNAETLVRLGDQTDDEFVQLGFLFPEGEGAFLSAGDQMGAKAKQQELNQMNRPAATSIAFDGGMDQFGGVNPYGVPPANPFEPVPPPAIGGGFDTFQGSNQWGGPPPAVGNPYGDPFAPQDGGKMLFVRALSGQEQQQAVPPPAIGGQMGAPPPALQTQDNDDWGITWDDEPEWTVSQESEGDNGAEKSPDEHPIKTVADHDDDDEADPKPNVISFSELERKYLSSVDALYIFLTRSLPKNLGTVQCKIKRSVVGLHVNYNLYELYLEREDGTLGPQIMIAQKHRKYGVDSYYNLAIGSVNKRESGKVISSLVFNTFGTHFLAHNDVSSHKGKPRDLAGVVYQRNIGKGPRKFQVAIPALREGSETEQVEWAHHGSVKKSKLIQSLVSLDFHGLQPLVNKKPTWSKKYRAWTLNFHGRVTRSSVKNFQLVRPDDDKNVVLQFGRIGTDTFTMDLSWPLSPAAAFAICVSSLHSKLAVE